MDNRLASFFDELEKISARRGVKEIRRSFQAGDTARADRLAKTPGVLSPGGAHYGSHMRFLDKKQGGEGIAELAAHGKHGIVVAKTYIPGAGMYSDEIIRRKEKVPELGKHGPNLKGTVDMPAGNRRHFYEFAPGKKLSRKEIAKDPVLKRKYFRALRSVKTEAKKKGFFAADLRPENAVLRPDGEFKFIDLLPVKNDEIAPARVRKRYRRMGMHNMTAFSTEQKRLKVMKPASNDLLRRFSRKYDADVLTGNSFGPKDKRPNPPEWHTKMSPPKAALFIPPAALPVPQNASPVPQNAAAAAKKARVPNRFLLPALAGIGAAGAIAGGVALHRRRKAQGEARV